MEDYDGWYQNKIIQDFLTFSPKGGFTVSSSTTSKEIFEHIANTWGRGPGDLRDIQKFKDCWGRIQRYWKLSEKKAKRYARYILTYLGKNPWRDEVTLISSDKSYLIQDDYRKLRELIIDWNNTKRGSDEWHYNYRKIDTFLMALSKPVIMPNFNLNNVQKMAHTHE